MAIEVKDEILTAKDVQVNIKTLHVAMSPRSYSLRRDIARQRIIEAVVEGLDPEDKKRFEEYERRENPCEEER